MPITNRIPSLRECQVLMNKYMLPNIIGHSQQVMRVALSIASNLKDNTNININLINAASLLHDITKAISLKTHEPHDVTGGLLLRDMGFNSVAEIVEEHIFLKIFDPDGVLEEKEIVYYADKRVMHTKIVTVEERINDIKIRYGKNQNIIKNINQNKQVILKVEKKIESMMKKSIDLAIIDYIGSSLEQIK